MATITKVKDSIFHGKHPNGVNAGYTKTIDSKPLLPVIGEGYRFGSLYTSDVTEIVSITDTEYIFKTINSIYQVML